MGTSLISSLKIQTSPELHEVINIIEWLKKGYCFPLFPFMLEMDL